VCGVGVTLCVSSCSNNNPVTPSPAPALSIACPAPSPTQSLDGKPVIVTYSPPVTSGGEGLVTTTCTPATSTLFSVGTTSVTCAAHDTRQHTATCAFPVSVTQVPRLSATRFLAFGDSMTAGVIATACRNGSPPTGLFWPDERTLLRLDESPGRSYPSVLANLLSQRYAPQSFTMVNEGQSGESATDGAVRFPRVLASTLPEVVLLLEGVNDINNLHADGIPSVVTSLRSMIRAARQRGATVLVSTLLPQRPGACRADGVDDVIPANLQLRPMVSAEGAVLVDLYPQFVPNTTTWLGLDGLHPNEAGYGAMAQGFLDAIRGRLEQQPSIFSRSPQWN